VLKRFVAVLTTAILAVGLTIGVALPASAHTPTVTASCAGLYVKFMDYGGGTTNKFTVTIDGKVVDTQTFADDFTGKSYSFDGSVAHSYVVEVDAEHNNHDRLVSKGTAFTGTTTPCTAACLNPLVQAKWFTIITEGNLTVNNGGAHVEGTAAVGGDLIVSQQYHVQNNHDGTPLPVVDGTSTGLLVGGKVTLNNSGEAFQVNAGATRIGDTTGASVKESNRYHPVIEQDRFIRMSANATLDQVNAPGLFGSTFAGAFDTMRANATTIAGYDDDDVALVTLQSNGGDGMKVTLVPNTTNVLRVNASTLSGVTKLFFGDVKPSAASPFIIDVTGSSTVTVAAPVLMNIDEEYVLWNFANATTLNLSTTEFVKGSVLAPRAQLNLTSGGIEGQIAAKSMVITSGAEIHHISYKPCATIPPTTVVVSTIPSATAPTCYVDGTLVLPTVANITWTGATNGAGPGTYTVKAVPATGYTLNGAQDTWTITVKQKGDGVNCVEAVKPTLTVAECNATSGALVSAFMTIPSTANLAYSMNGGTPFTPGQKVDLGVGSHTVNVVATNGYTNTGPSSFTIVVGAYDCNESVKPALTLAVCNPADNTLTSAFITIPSTTPGLEYRITGVNGGAALSGNVQLAAGTYTVNVTAKAGYQNTGASSFTIVVPAVTCEKAVQPDLTSAYCHATTGAFQSGYITITTTTPGLEYRIAGQNGNQPLSGTVNLPAGTYTVTVTAKAGVTNTGPSSFTIVLPALTCEESVEPALTAAQCDVASGVFTSAFVTIPSTTPGLEYRITGVNGGAALSGKVELAAGTYTVTVTAKAGVTNTGATSFPITVAALSCEKAVEPTLAVAQCDANGDPVGASLTATTTTPGLTYTIRGGAVLTPGVATTVAAGTYIVDVTAAAGMTNTGPASFTIEIDDLDCNKAEEPLLTAGQCDILTGPSSAFITIPTTTPGLIYSIGGADYAAGDKVNLPAGPYQVDVRAIPGVTNTGPSQFTGTVAVVDCEEEEYVAPTVTPQTCDKVIGGTKDGSLLFTLNSDMEYWLDGTLVTTALVSNVTPGAHTVKVVPAVGHHLKGGVDTFTVTVPAAVGCDNVYTTPLDPFADPEICDPQSTNTLDGSITVVHIAGVQWFIGTKADGSDKVAVGDDTTVGNVKYAYPAGDYFVFAEAVDPTISIKPGHEVFPLTVDFPKDLCTLGFFDPSASATSAVCNAAGDDRGTITVDIMPGVTYAFQGGPTITTAQTKVAPGTYTVVATPDDPRSALSRDTWVLTVTAPVTILCDLETLAFTGQNSNGVWILAILLLQAGLVLVAVQFVRMRRARHVAR